MCLNMNISVLTDEDRCHGVRLKATVQSERDERMYYNVVRLRKWECDCPHWVFRNPVGGCKHIKAVKLTAKLCER